MVNRERAPGGVKPCRECFQAENTSHFYQDVFGDYNVLNLFLFLFFNNWIIEKLFFYTHWYFVDLLKWLQSKLIQFFYFRFPYFAGWLFKASLDRMASIERKQQFFSLIAQRRNPLIKTSAEIVTEARRTLRVQATQRPFTPVNATRELFGNSKDCPKTRPPSSFRLDTHIFMNSI